MFYDKVIEAATAKGYKPRQNKRGVSLHFDNLKKTHIGFELMKKGIRVGMWVGGAERNKAFNIEIFNHKDELEREIGLPIYSCRDDYKTVLVPVDYDNVDKATESAIELVDRVKDVFKPYIK